MRSGSPIDGHLIASCRMHVLKSAELAEQVSVSQMCVEEKDVATAVLREAADPVQASCIRFLWVARLYSVSRLITLQEAIDRLSCVTCRHFSRLLSTMLLKQQNHCYGIPMHGRFAI